MATTTLAALLKLLMVLITTGWVCVWILLPTDLWRRLWKVAEERARGTVFGYYGLNFAVFSLPIIAVAILGYLYLHIYTREQRNRWRGVSFPKLSAPLIIRSPLGILSLAELLTATLFIFFLAWTFYSRISNDLDKMKPIKSMPLNKWQFKVMKTGTRLGLLSEACLVLLLLPVLRGMAVFQLLGIQFETSIRYHIWLGNTMMVFATLHGFLTLFVWGIKQKLTNEIFRWQKTGRVNIAGEITLAVGLLIWLTSLPPIRRKRFQLFYYTHHLYLIFLVFFLFHAGDRHFYSVLAGVLLYALDKLLRIVQSRQVTCLVSAQVLPCKAVELTLSKHPDLRYTPTSVIFLNIPSISRFQWHPFSITSCSDVNLDRITVIAKCQGQWTNQLYNVIHAAVDSNVNHIKCLPVAVEGPYGPPSIYYQRYDSLLLVAGGIGITPFLSILQEINSRNRNNRSKLATSAQLIYVVKKSQDLSMLSSIFPLVLNGSHGQNHIRLQVYVTQEERSSNSSLMELLQGFTQEPKVLFEANCFKHTVAAPESLLSMAIITVFSLLVFAISIGFLSHAFLGSGRKESNKKNPSWVSDVLVISSFIITAIFAITAGVILRWRKRKKEICMFSPKETQGLELHLKEAQGSLQEQEIYFRRRPNFQEIFSKFETQIGGSNVGVLVCGPESMQESVATVCRQYSYKENAKKRRCSFNFQSLNFAL